jgi:cAMP phosphodiesterase
MPLLRHPCHQQRSQRQPMYPIVCRRRLERPALCSMCFLDDNISHQFSISVGTIAMHTGFLPLGRVLPRRSHNDTSVKHVITGCSANPSNATANGVGHTIPICFRCEVCKLSKLRQLHSFLLLPTVQMLLLLYYLRFRL